MAVRPANQTEPIPGYRLLERLGRGGFGEVWKAEAPGGLFKAIKFVYGDLEEHDKGGVAAEQELKALNRVKTVRHPYILSLERVDIVDGQLVIVMELADRNLLDRFRECHTQGLSGIPRDEILGYMLEAAEALDLMNGEYQLQHLDIKPQNLFLVRNHIKVADFGLCKDLQDFKASITGGVTPLYAAPETFEGWVSPFCDQYSLAIVYQELLTGQRPFDGTNARQLLLQHIQQPPDVAPLPPDDQPVIARALSKKPAERFPTCGDMVRALIGSGHPAGIAHSEGAPTVREADSQVRKATPTMPEIRIDDSPITDVTRSASRSSQAITKNLSPQRPPGTQKTPGAAEVLKTPRPVPAAKVQTPRPAPIGGEDGMGTDTNQAIRLSAPVEFTGAGSLMPGLIVGIGEMGRHVVQRLRQALFERYGELETAVPHLRLLYLDTDPDGIGAAMRGNHEVAMEPSQVMVARLNRPSHYLKPRDVHTSGNQPSLLSWLDPKMLYRIPRNQLTAGVRALGRLAFVDNYTEIADRLRETLGTITDPESLAAADRQTKLGLRVNRPRVYIACGLGGGTGSGMFIDVAYTIRSMLKVLGYLAPDVVGVFFLPSIEQHQNQPVVLGNTCAALTELNHFSSPGTVFTGRYLDKQPPLSDADAPFGRCILLPQDSDERTPEDVAGQAAGLVFRDLMTPLGREADARRNLVLPPPVAPRLGSKTKVPPVCATFATYRFSWPRRILIEHASRRIGQRIVEHWVAKDAGPIREEVTSWVKDQWAKRQLEADVMIACLRAAAEGAVDGAPEEAFQAIAEPLTKVPANALPDLTMAQIALAGAEGFVGRPDGYAPMTKPAVIVEALDQAANNLLVNCEQKLAEMAVHLVEQPRYRFAGADEAIRQIGTLINTTIERQETLCNEFMTKAAEAYKRITAMIEALKTAAATKKRPPHIELLPDLIRTYPGLRFKGLVLQRLLTVYRSLQGNCPEYLREFTYCRARLSDLVKTFGRMPDRTGSALELGPGRHLFPAGCRSLEDAVNQLVNGLKAADMLDLDKKVQAAVQKHFKALVHVCTTPATSIVRDVELVMLEELEKSVKTRLGTSNVLATFLSQYPQEQAAQNQIATAFEETMPQLEARALTSRSQVALVVVPADPEVEQFRGLAEKALSDAAVVTGVKGDDVIFYRELAGIELSDLPHLGAEGKTAYDKVSSAEHFTPHCRTDITDWRAATQE